MLTPKKLHRSNYGFQPRPPQAQKSVCLPKGRLIKINLIFVFSSKYQIRSLTAPGFRQRYEIMYLRKSRSAKGFEYSTDGLQFTHLSRLSDLNSGLAAIVINAVIIAAIGI